MKYKKETEKNKSKTKFFLRCTV